MKVKKNKPKAKLNRKIEKPHPEKDRPKDFIQAPTKFQPKFTGIDIGIMKNLPVGAYSDMPKLGNGFGMNFFR